MPINDKRPELTDKISLQDFKDFYWTKKELMVFCKQNEMTGSGEKIEITNRIILFLKTGEKTHKKADKAKPKSKFDWNKETLTTKTIITDNYKNSENVRKFFACNIGTHFKFNVMFLKWMQQNIGKTLKDAIDEWNRIYDMRKDKNFQTEIDSQCEYNQYLRDFLKDNPNLSMADARKYWMLKRNKRGNNKYSREDFKLG